MKNLIICLDGTWSDADSAAPQTNIALLASIIDPNPQDGAEQRVYYDAGVGTGGFLDRIVGGAFGRGLSANVLAAYRFLSQFYRPGDNIYVFGFSRGAFTARSLCGLISASGLLTQEMCNAANQEFAWAYYRTPPKARFPADRARLARFTYNPEPRIRFLGAFDTVGALGIPKGFMSRLSQTGHPVPRRRCQQRGRLLLPRAGHRRAPLGVRGGGVDRAATPQVSLHRAGLVPGLACQRRRRLRRQWPVRPGARMDAEAPHPPLSRAAAQCAGHLASPAQPQLQGQALRGARLDVLAQPVAPADAAHQSLQARAPLALPPARDPPALPTDRRDGALERARPLGGDQGRPAPAALRAAQPTSPPSRACRTTRRRWSAWTASRPRCLGLYKANAAAAPTAQAPPPRPSANGASRSGDVVPVRAPE